MMLIRSMVFLNLSQQIFVHIVMRAVKLRNIHGVKARTFETLQPALYLLVSSLIKPSNANDRKNAFKAANMKTSDTEN